MVTIAPMKFGAGTSRLHLESNFGTTTLTSSSSSSSSTSPSTFRCKLHNGFSAVVLGRDLLSPTRATVCKSTPHQLRRPPNGREQQRDLCSSRSPKTSSNIGGGGSFANTFDVEQYIRLQNSNVTNHLPISSPVSSSAQHRGLETRRPPPPSSSVLEPRESPRRQQPFNPTGMTRKTAVTPRACRKAVVTQVRTDQARVVHQIASNGSVGVPISRSNGLPKFHLNEQPSAVPNSKCRSINCKSSATHNQSTGNDKRENSQQRTSLNSHTISSLNKIVKSSMSSSNTSRDTSIESIVPKYKTIEMESLRSAASGESKLVEVSCAQKRSYNPQMLIRTNKFILNDEKIVSRTTNVIIPRIRTSLNENKCGGASNGTTHRIPICRELEEKVTVPTSNNAFKVSKDSHRSSNRADQRVPGDINSGGSVRALRHHLYENCDTDFFHQDPSNESLYIDFSKKRSPEKSINKMELPSLRPINKDVLLQRGIEGVSTCDYTYQFEVTKRQQNEQKSVTSRPTSDRLLSGSNSSKKGHPSVFYVSCASWMPKCNNKFSLRERRLLEESKTISRKR